MKPRSELAAWRLIFCAIPLGALLPVSCSFTSLDHLNRGEEQRGGGGGSGAESKLEGGATAAGRDANGSGMAGEVGTGAGASGGETAGGGGETAGGSEPAGGSEGGGGGGETAGGGGETAGGGGETAGGGGETAGGGESAGSGGESAGGGGGEPAGGGGEGGEAGSGSGIPSLTYGVLGQSCKVGETCPGGVSCCARIEVPEGTFQMGTNTDPEASADEKPPHDANIDAFFLDQFEVTVGRFRRFVDAYDGTLPDVNQGTHPSVAQSGWKVSFAAYMPASRGALVDEINCDLSNGYQTWTELAGVQETYPMNCVSWYVAFAFCVWDGGRLPTEAEWEKAAAGGSEERLYPWGDTAPAPDTHAVMNCMGDRQAGCDPADILAVGSRPGGAGAFGHLDLAGSLWEWTLDYYDATYYQSIGTCDNCANVSGTTPRAIRGGNFNSVAYSLRATLRASKPPNAIDPYAGFRCAYSP